MRQRLMQKIVSLCKRRGFVYPGSEIYGGLANTYDYGPLGVELLRNIKNLWWKHFVNKRPEIYGLHSAVIMNPKVWEASGHTESFTDTLVDCRQCQNRIRADHLIENYFEDKKEKVRVEGRTPRQLERIINQQEIPCPSCGAFNWTSPREFNILFETQIGIVPESQSLAYLRGEIAQGMFINFKPVLDSIHPALPFGLAQSGAAFRNEVTLGNFIFRTLQFNLSELEYFFDIEKENWQNVYDYWKKEIYVWTAEVLELNKNNLRWRLHTAEERAHYSKKTEDLDYNFPFGFKELFALAYRTDFDLGNHMEKSGVDLRYFDPDRDRRFIPHVMEPTFGMDRAFLALLIDAYKEEKDRVLLSLPARLAPYQAAVFPLLANKPELVAKAREVFNLLKNKMTVTWDDRGNIGKRYYSQDEIGTPFCVTVDFDTLKDDTVTIRERDSMRQVRVNIVDLIEAVEKLLDSEIKFQEAGRAVS